MTENATDTTARVRCTAALLSTTPTISARLVHHDLIVLEVMRPPHPVRDHTVVPPCWFRAFVADGLAHGPPTDTLARSRFERLAACRIELGVRGGTVLLPGNVLRVDTGDAWMHLHAVPSPLGIVEPVVAAGIGGEGSSRNGEAPIELQAAADLGVTVVRRASDRSDVASARVTELLQTISMRVAVDRLERQLRAMSEHPARGRDDAPVLRRRDR